MSTKSTAIELAKRILIVQDWIIESKPDYKIIRDAVKKWGITERQAKNYKAKAFKIWNEKITDDKDQERRLAIAKHEINRANLEKKYKGTPAGIRAILAVDKEIARLKALHPQKELVVKGDPDAPIEINSVDNIDKRIGQILQKAVESGDTGILDMINKALGK